MGFWTGDKKKESVNLPKIQDSELTTIQTEQEKQETIESNIEPDESNLPELPELPVPISSKIDEQIESPVLNENGILKDKRLEIKKSLDRLYKKANMLPEITTNETSEDEETTLLNRLEEIKEEKLLKQQEEEKQNAEQHNEEETQNYNDLQYEQPRIYLSEAECLREILNSNLLISKKLDFILSEINKPA